jgi:prepilin-type N-terminal cleavage/methylation domain-containing protein
MNLRKRGFTLLELLAVLIVGAIIIGALASTVISVLRGSSGLMHYSDMKHQSDRLLSYFANDVYQADSVSFPALDSDELMAFQLFSGGTALVTYSYGVDSTPPQGANGTVYCIYREPFGSTRYEIATGFTSPPSETVHSGSAEGTATSFFFFLDKNNQSFDHTTALGKTLASRGTTKIRLNGIMERGGSGDYPITHEVSTLSVLKGRVTLNSY